MRKNKRKTGFTLAEMLVTIGVVALLMGLSMPAMRMMVSSMSTTGGATSMISAALASARAIAAKEQRYAGVRFQKVYQPDGPHVADQYMIFIIHDPSLTWANSFRVVEGLKPIKLPEGMGVMDLRIRANIVSASDTSDLPISLDTDIDQDSELRDTAAFSIIFSPSGKLVIHKVRIDNIGAGDTVFNTQAKVKNKPPTGMFFRDDDANLGLGAELSRNNFVIYDRTRFKPFFQKGIAYSKYLELLKLDTIYINPYTGTMIEK